jgi:hypothetical protein
MVIMHIYIFSLFPGELIFLTTWPPRLPLVCHLFHPRPRSSPLASQTPISRPPPNRRRGVGRLSRLQFNACLSAFTIHVVARCIITEAVVRSRCHYRAWPLPPRGGRGAAETTWPPRLPLDLHHPPRRLCQATSQCRSFNQTQSLS